MVVYHTTWGWPYFDDLFPPGRRILYLHSDTPGLDEQLQTRAHWADGFACVNDRIAERVMQARPDLSPDRLLRVLYPIDPPAAMPGPARPWGSPLRLGFCGRLAHEQKRIDRIPELVNRLNASGIQYQLEFLGDGPERAWLESQLPDRKRFVFHGRKSGAEYWDILSSWDALLFVSDYEGTPIALLEAMAAGVIPIHPAIGSGGDRYAAEVDPLLAYPAGDLNALAALISDLARWPTARIEIVRRRAIDRVHGHASAVYRATFAGFLRHIANQPPFPDAPCPRGLPVWTGCRSGPPDNSWTCAAVGTAGESFSTAVRVTRYRKPPETGYRSTSQRLRTAGTIDTAWSALSVSRTAPSITRTVVVSEASP